MADPISLASGLVALATFALQSSQALYGILKSFQNNQRSIRELREELEALDGVLQTLGQTVVSGNNGGIELEELKLPLYRCGRVCGDFESVLLKCVTHSGGPRTSFRNWARLRYMGEDITGFKNMLAGYKATINIALGGANLRTARVTVEVLKQYKEMIDLATLDLQEHLQEMNEKLRQLSVPGSGISSDAAEEGKQILDEKASTEQCLRICEQVHEYITQQEPKGAQDSQTTSSIRIEAIELIGNYLSAQWTTRQMLNECKSKLVVVADELRRRLEEMKRREAALSLGGGEAALSAEARAEFEQVQEEKNGTELCLGICAQATQQTEQARTNVIEDVSAVDDAHQVVVATLGDLISAHRITAGDRSTQWLGQMSDVSLQQLSRDRALFPAADGRSVVVGELDIIGRGGDGDAAKRFAENHGTGHTLSRNLFGGAKGIDPS